jgi:RNase P subunit RPR2
MNRVGVNIWLINPLNTNAVQYTPGSIKLKQQPALTRPINKLNMTARAISHLLVGNSCSSKRFYTPRDPTQMTMTVSCAACGQGMYSDRDGVVKEEIMVYLPGYFNLFHMDGCVQKCSKCEDFLVPRYGASISQTLHNPNATCVPLKCYTCADHSDPVFNTGAFTSVGSLSSDIHIQNNRDENKTQRSHKKKKRKTATEAPMATTSIEDNDNLRTQTWHANSHTFIVYPTMHSVNMPETPSVMGVPRMLKLDFGGNLDK